MSKTRVSHEYGADLCRGVQSGKIAFLDLVSGKITCNREKAGAAVALERQASGETGTSRPPHRDGRFPA
jgi:hypothetical protein